MSTSAEEAWRDVVEKCDSSETFELEAYRLKARRKFAIVKNLQLDEVSLEEVTGSPQGVALPGGLR